MLTLLSEIKQDTDLPTRLVGICVMREVNGTPSQHAAHPVAGRLPRDQAMAAGYQILLPVKLSLAPPHGPARRGSSSGVGLEESDERAV